MERKFGRTLSALAGAALMFQAVGCGTILHPERKGQRGGRIDVGVAVLDAVGLLFFLIPGVIAFAVDFSNGTIYLPGGGPGLFNRNDFERLRFDPQGDAKAAVEAVLRRRTGLRIRLDQDEMEVVRLSSLDELSARLAIARR